MATDNRKSNVYALAVFYYSTDGDSWTNNDGWLSDGMMQLVYAISFMNVQQRCVYWSGTGIQ
jgi:hypothetical protein